MSDTLEVEGDSVSYSPGPTSANSSVPQTSAKAALVKQVEVTSSVAKLRQDQIPVLLNASNAAKKTAPQPVPEPLPEVPGVGYVRGKEFPLTLVKLDNKWTLEKSAGYDFLLMRRAALREKSIVLRINSAFRTQQEQIDIAKDHELHPDKGPAAIPGYSNHQQGLSLDIHTGINFTDWKSGKVLTSTIHTWLEGNAARFGFNQRDLKLLPDGRRWEPWHWTHTSDGVIYGVKDAEGDLADQYDLLVSAGEESSYTANGEPDLFRLILKIGYDTSRTWERSALGFTATRTKIYGAATAHSMRQSSEISRRGAAQGFPLQLTMPKGFGATPPLYDFESGLWTDGDENGIGV